MKLIDELVGKKVTVFSVQGGGERQDVGTLESVDDAWMRVRKSENELLYFNTFHVRLVKPFDPH